jgi:serine/threonine protein phosphatase PrpC
MLQQLLLETSSFRCQAALWVGQQHLFREDRLVLAIMESNLMAAVLDGMGGLPRAAEAAKTAGEAILNAWKEGLACPKQLIVAANTALLTVYGLNRVGVTASVIVIDSNSLLRSAWIGDVRVSLREGDSWNPVTRDHTRLAEFTAPSIPTSADAQRHSELARRVTKSLGEKTLNVNDIDSNSHKWTSDILLCSDGFWTEIDLTSSFTGIPQLYSCFKPDDDATVLIIEKSDDCRPRQEDTLMIHV